MPSATRHAPTGQLTLRRGGIGPGVLLSLGGHVSAFLLVLWLGADAFLAGAGPGGPGARGGGGGGGRTTINFFVLPTYTAAPAVELPPAPTVAALLPLLPSTPIPLPQLEIPRAAVSSVSPVTGAGTGTGGGGQGAGTGGGQGPGSGTGAGAAVGPGTGGEGGYIFPARPRWTIIPPTRNVPADMRGRQYRVRFWVSVDGRVTRVEIEPPIRDGSYRREFLERMSEYLFTPAMTRDGQRVASVTDITVTLP